MKVKLPNGKVVTMVDNEESRAEIAKDNSAITDGPKFEIMPNVVQEEKIIDNISSDAVVKKLVPNDFGIVNKPVFESIKEIREVLDIPMSGKEIKERYDINFPINDKTIFRPIN